MTTALGTTPSATTLSDGDGRVESGNDVSPRRPLKRVSWPPNTSSKYITQKQSSLDPRPHHPPRHAHCPPRRRTRRVGSDPPFIMSRPPRAQRPQSHQQLQVPSSPYSPSQQHQPIPQTGISFQEYETGDRAGPLPPGSRQRRYSAAIEDPQSAGARVGRKRSLVRPERERIEPGHRQYHYRNMASQLDEHSTRNVMPSSMRSFSIFFVPCSPSHHHHHHLQRPAICQLSPNSAVENPFSPGTKTLPNPASLSSGEAHYGAEPALQMLSPNPSEKSQNAVSGTTSAQAPRTHG